MFTRVSDRIFQDELYNLTPEEIAIVEDWAT
jgi:hypothetical protein